MKSIAVVFNTVFCIVNCILGFMTGSGFIEIKYFILGMVLMFMGDVFFFWALTVIERNRREQ